MDSVSCSGNFSERVSQVAALYIKPVSRNLHPSDWLVNRPTVLLPEATGPSMAIWLLMPYRVPHLAVDAKWLWMLLIKNMAWSQVADTNSIFLSRGDKLSMYG